MFKLYQHQEIALSYLRANDRFALFMEQGTGKTLVTLSRISELLKKGKINNYLVVAPKSALGAWERDIELFDTNERQKLLECGTFINYDRVWRNNFDSQEFDLIALDEAHCIKNRTSNRSKALLKLGCKSKYNYILTGTPISNGQLENIWSLYCFLDPYAVKSRIYSNIFKDFLNQHANGDYKGSYYDFLNRYCMLDRYHKPSAYKNVNELQDIINEYSYRVKKVDCLDLPDKLPDEIIKVELKEKTRYKKLRDSSALLEYELLAENPLSRLLKLRQVASGYIQNEDELIELKTDKLNILSELLESYADKKLVVFAEFKYSISQISKLLSKLKIKHVVLDGEQKDKSIWRKFQADESIKVIVCQYQTASAGIDLFAADTMLFYEPTLRSQILEQARDRIHRSGQTNKCSYIHLLTTGTVEVDIYRALTNYSDFNEKLFLEYMSEYTKGSKV